MAYHEVTVQIVIDTERTYLQGDIESALSNIYASGDVRSRITSIKPISDDEAQAIIEDMSDPDGHD